MPEDRFAMLEVFVNGGARAIRPGTTLAELIRELELEPRFVAVEVNLELVPRARHAEHVLGAGDRLEVVTLVGGG